MKLIVVTGLSPSNKVYLLEQATYSNGLILLSPPNFSPSTLILYSNLYNTSLKQSFLIRVGLIISWPDRMHYLMSWDMKLNHSERNSFFIASWTHYSLKFSSISFYGARLFSSKKYGSSLNYGPSGTVGQYSPSLIQRPFLCSGLQCRHLLLKVLGVKITWSLNRSDILE